MSVALQTMPREQVNTPFAGNPSYRDNPLSITVVLSYSQPIAKKELHPDQLISHTLACGLDDSRDKRTFSSDNASPASKKLKPISHADGKVMLKDSALANSDTPQSSEAPFKVTLPSLNDALAGIENKRAPQPTVSQDDFDTYKLHDENWRFGLLDLIRKTKPVDNLSSFGNTKKPKLPSIEELNNRERSLFDSRVGNKGLLVFPALKFNFPYESNYIYLNQTYMKDVECYPEYLELGPSLVLLSRHQPKTTPLVHAYDVRSSKPGLRIQTPSYREHCAHPQHQQPQTFGSLLKAQLSNPMVHHGLPTPQLATFNSPVCRAHQHGYILLPNSAILPGISQIAYATPDNSFEYKPLLPHELVKDQSDATAQTNAGTRFIPITPPSVKNKTRSELIRSPSKMPPALPRMCISCGSDQSACWRPSWSPKEGQLCNSCGLRYKKTAARCLNPLCKKIPAKGEWSSMVSKGMVLYNGVEAYSCLSCRYKVECNIAS